MPLVYLVLNSIQIAAVLLLFSQNIHEVQCGHFESQVLLCEGKGYFLEEMR